jgi:glycerol-3-phosphate dehydrogenase (NAD(P)+)
VLIKKEKISFIGIGKFGTAISYRLDLLNRYEISFYSRDDNFCQEFNFSKQNSRCFSEKTFSKNTNAYSNLYDCVAGSSVIFITTESNSLIDTASKIAPVLSDGASIVICGKGISDKKPYFYSEILKNIFGGKNINILVFSGPNFADEILNGELSVTTLACKNQKICNDVAAIFKGTNIKIETTADIIGVQLFGAMKNVMAITVGMLEGLGFGKNRIIRTLMSFVSEIKRLGKLYGSKDETAYLSAGIGDIMLTCFDDKSRNKSFGVRIGNGESVEAVLKDYLVEGYWAVKSIRDMSKESTFFTMNKVSLRYIDAVYDILYKHSNPKTSLNSVEKNTPSQKPTSVMFSNAWHFLLKNIIFLLTVIKNLYILIKKFMKQFFV